MNRLALHSPTGAVGVHAPNHAVEEFADSQELVITVILENQDVLVLNTETKLVTKCHVPSGQNGVNTQHVLLHVVKDHEQDSERVTMVYQEIEDVLVVPWKNTHALMRYVLSGLHGHLGHNVVHHVVVDR